MIRPLALACLLANPAAAQSTGQPDTIALPAGCTAYVTIQRRGCSVSHLFTCQGDPEGYQRRIDLDEEQVVYAGIIDAETQWIESNHFLSGSTDRLAPGAPDPASFTELTETGQDTFEFSTISDPFGVTVYKGSDALTGVTVTIDGIHLEETFFEVVASDPSGVELWRVEGNEYINRDWRTFLSGIRTVTTPSDVFETDGRPVEFVFPGEPGFLSARPRHDCGVMLSKMTGG